MNGRKIFNLIHHPLLILSFIFKIFPDFILRFVWSLLLSFNGYIAKGLRFSILKSRSKDIGSNLLIGASTHIKHWANFSCGNNVSIHDNCFIDCDGGISIGNNVSIAHSSSLVSANHTWLDKDMPIKYNPMTKKGITIHNDVWIGCGVRVLDGVTIYGRCVIAAGAIINKDVASYSLMGGIPAKKIKAIN